jgi:phosphonate transport system substrate-binding protein
MLNRRTVLVALGASTGLATAARAQAWKARYPELVFAIVPAENASGVTERYGPFVNYLARELGTKVTLRIANDYAAVIEGQRSGHIHIAAYGPASFARARMTGVKADAFVIDVNGDGTKGYYSVFYVMAKSPFQKLEDLRGKNVGMVDPNSASGYAVPMFTLNQLGIPDASRYFGRVQNTGSHENAIIALTQGTVDVATNWWNAEDDSNLVRMLNKGMLKHADGRPMTYQDFRIVLRSPLIVNSPTAMLSDLPEELRSAIRTAFLQAHVKDAAAFRRLSDGKARPWEATDNATYDDTIKMVQFVDQLRRRGGS